MVDVHLPPSLTPADRHCVCRRAASFLLSSTQHLIFQQGDSNADLGPHGGGWLSRMLKPSGIWSFLHCVNADTSPSNIVHMHLRSGSKVVFQKLTDWLLVSSQPSPHPLLPLPATGSQYAIGAASVHGF